MERQTQDDDSFDDLFSIPWPVSSTVPSSSLKHCSATLGSG